MWRVVTCLMALALCGCRHGTRPEGQPPRAESSKDELELFHSLGVAAAGEVDDHELTAEEKALVKAGFEDRLAGKAPPVDEQAVEAAGEELLARAQALKQERDRAFLARAAGEAGAVKLESGAVFRSLEEGSGPAPEDTDTLEMQMKSMLADGTLIYDSQALGLTQLFDPGDGEESRCLREGLLRMKEGGRARLVCPPEEALFKWLGSVAPPDAIGLFEVRLVKVVRPEPPAVAKPELLPPPVYHQVDVPADAPSVGPRHAKVTVVVWLGRCQECSGLDGPLKRLRQKYGQELRLVPRIHFKPGDVGARRAAEALLAAHAQGRAWDYFEAFLSWPEASEDRLRQIASSLKLDMERFGEAFDFRLFRARAEAQGAEGRALGLDGENITLFVNGRELRRTLSDEVLEKVVAEEKARAERLLAAGTPPGKLYTRLIVGGRKPAPTAAFTEKGMERFELGHSPRRGPATAPVTLVVFADFQDVTSAELVPRLRWLEREYGGKLQFVFKHHPSPKSPWARRAALAALAAHEQGKFWEYHDRLFANQGELDDEALLRHARQVGLDARRFQEALASGHLERRLDIDEREARWLELGQPSVIWIDRRPLYSPNINQLRQRIDAALKRKQP
ncbi:MAG TPA: DsbA family protein [Myxococcus sp.]|nr:DsbA family protein [Myxococcus sp.]